MSRGANVKHSSKAKETLLALGMRAEKKLLRIQEGETDLDNFLRGGDYGGE